MRAMLCAAALTAALLTTAGSGLALIETAGAYGALVQSQVEATDQYAWDTWDRVGAVAGAADPDVEGKAAALHAVAGAVASNAAGQGAATVNLASAVAVIVLGSGSSAGAMFLGAAPSGEDLAAALAACSSHPDPVGAALACQAVAVAWVNAVVEA